MISTVEVIGLASAAGTGAGGSSGRTVGSGEVTAGCGRPAGGLSTESTAWITGSQGMAPLLRTRLKETSGS